jgi:hypothetical protein
MSFWMPPDFVAPLKKEPHPPIVLNLNRISPHGRDRRQICLAVSPNWSDGCDDRNPVKERPNERNAIDNASQWPLVARSSSGAIRFRCLPVLDHPLDHTFELLKVDRFLHKRPCARC